jgi:hypothetical protein
VTRWGESGANRFQARGWCAALDEQDAKRRQALYRLAIARSDIKAAAEIAAYAEKYVPDMNELWIPLQDALVSAYARPFTSNRPHGPLANAWAKFSDPRHQELHRELIALRNELVAHSDASRRTVVVFPPNVPFLDGREPLARVTLAIGQTRRSPDFFKSVRELCDDLLGRLHAATEEQLQHLFGDTNRTRPFDLLTGEDREMRTDLPIISETPLPKIP